MFGVVPLNCGISSVSNFFLFLLGILLVFYMVEFDRIAAEGLCDYILSLKPTVVVFTLDSSPIIFPSNFIAVVNSLCHEAPRSSRFVIICQCSPRI